MNSSVPFRYTWGANEGLIAAAKMSRFIHSVTVIPMSAGPTNLAVYAAFGIAISEVSV
jgi:hypothetical protein